MGKAVNLLKLCIIQGLHNYITSYITPLVINTLRVGTCAQAHTFVDKSNFKKPRAYLV